MSGFATAQAVVDAYAAGGGHHSLFSKTAASVSVARIPHSFWTAAGTPVAGANPGVSNTGTVPTDATAGALDYPLAPTAQVHVTGLGGQASGTTGTLIVCDRICHTNLSIATVAGTNLTSFTATSRLAAAAGAQIWMEVTTALSAAANTFTFTYTNQAGVGSRGTSTVTTASAVINRSPNGDCWVPLQAGDVGVRSIESYTIAGTATGNVNLCLVRPIAYIPLLSTTSYTERNFLAELVGLERVYDGSCLFLIMLPVGAATPVIFGDLAMAEG